MLDRVRHEQDPDNYVTLRGDMVVRELRGLRVLHRLRTDTAWYLAMANALDLCSLRHCCGKRLPCCARARDAAVNRQLDLLDAPLSGLERRVIFTYATGRNEA